MKQIRAFTIVELIVVMIVSIITLATIYTVYVIVRKQFFHQSQKLKALNSCLQFQDTFLSDINMADSVKCEDETNELTCYKKADSIYYSFTAQSIVRRQNVIIDSFQLHPNNLKIQMLNNTRIVSEIEVNIVPFSDTVLLHLKKEYDATNLINFK